MSEAGRAVVFVLPDNTMLRGRPLAVMPAETDACEVDLDISGLCSVAHA